jgi:5-methyltetrahydrofolate corrinoid/iron sulfur protein methyltransferase
LLVIGEKINGTRQAVREAVISRDEGFIAGLAREQADAGADYIDVNVATGDGETEAMEWAVGVVKGVTDKPLALDSADPSVLERGLELCGEDRPFINSISGEAERLEGVLPLAVKYSCPVVALAMDESGIPETPESRLAVCRGIMERAREAGLPEADLYFDPLVLPVSADCEQGSVTIETLRLIISELPEVKTVMGLSNISFGLPLRTVVNRAMMAVAVYEGLDAAIIDPSDRGLLGAAYAAEALRGGDRYCRGYMKAFRSGLIG